MALRVFSPEELEQIRREQMESGLYDRLLSDYEPAEEEAPQQQKPVERGAWDTVTSSVARSVDQSQALGWGVLAAGADLVGADGVRDRALEGYNEQMRQAAENPAEIGTYKNIDSIGDAGTYALESLGELVPTLATILVSGGIGGGIARAAAPKVLGQMLEKQIAANIAKGATKEAAEAAAKKYVQSTLGGIGEKVGGWAASSALEAGSMYGDDVQEHGVEGASAGRALGLGALSGATDVMLGGESLMLGKLLGGMGKDAAEKGSKYIGREMLKGFAREGGQEVLQEIIQMGNSVVSSMQNTGDTAGEVLSEKGGEFLDRGIDSFLKGGIAGVPMAAGGHMLDKRIAMLDAERKKAEAEGDVNKLTQIDKEIAGARAEVEKARNAQKALPAAENPNDGQLALPAGREQAALPSQDEHAALPSGERQALSGRDEQQQLPEGSRLGALPSGEPQSADGRPIPAGPAQEQQMLPSSVRYSNIGTTPMTQGLGVGLIPLQGGRDLPALPQGTSEQVEAENANLDREWNARQAELRQRNDQARVNQMDTDLDKTEAKIRAEHEAKRDQMRATAMGRELDTDWQARQDELAVRNQEADLNNTEHKIRQQLAERQAKNAKFAPVYERLNKKANKGKDVSQDEASDRLEAAAAEAPRKVTVGEAVRRIEEAKAEGDNADMAHLDEWIKTLKDAEAEADADTTSLRNMSEWVSFIRDYQDQYGMSVGSQKELAKVMGDAAYERDNERMEADWARRADEHKVKADNATLDAEWVTRLEERDRANAQRQTAAVSKQTEQTTDAPKVELATIKNKKTRAKRTKAEVLEAAKGKPKERTATEDMLDFLNFPTKTTTPTSDAPTVQSGNTITRKAKQNDAKTETKTTADPIATLREAVMAESASAKKTYTDEQKADRAGVIEDLAEIRGNKNHYLQTVASKYFSKPELRRLFDFLAKQGDDADLTVEDIVKGAKIAPHSLDIKVDDLGRMFKKKGRKDKAKAKATAETKTQEKTEPKVEPKAEPKKEAPVEPKTKPLIDRVRAVFPNMDYRQLKDTGSVIVVTPNGSAILIREEDVLINDNVEGHWSNSAIIEKDFGVRLDRGGIIALSKLNQADTTLDHEMIHAAMSLALTETERKILYKQYGGNTKNRRAAEEKIAEAYEKWTPAPTKAEEKKGLFRKMWDASKKLHRVLFGGKGTADTADQVMARLRSGEAWKKNGGRDVGLTLEGAKLRAKLDRLQREIEDGFTYGSGSYAPMFSLRTYKESIKALLSDNKKHGAIPEAEMKKYVKDITSIARLILHNPNLQYETSGNYSPLKDNSDPHYKYSMDFSTICKKRLQLAATIDALQQRIGRGLLPAEIGKVRRDLMKAGITVSCGICYVDATRIKSGLALERFLNLNKQYAGLKKYFLSQDGMDQLYKDHKNVYQEFKEYAAAQNIKTSESRAEYTDEIYKLTDGDIAKFNARSGMRWQSWSDFELPHLIDAMQAIGHMAARKMKGHTYTKVVEMVRALGHTGMMINMSLIPIGSTGLDEHGNLVFSPVEGMDFDDMIDLRLSFSKTAGSIAIGINDEQIRKLMASDVIDYIIPYHVSGLPESIRDNEGFREWKDYTKVQVEKVADAAKLKKHGTLDDFKEWAGHISEWWNPDLSGDENAQIYLKKAEEWGITPKFEAFKNESGYWKLLIDRKMYDNDGNSIVQGAVKPVFDSETITGLLRDYKPDAKDAHSETVEKYAAEFPKDIDVEDMMTGTQWDIAMKHDNLFLTKDDGLKKAQLKTKRKLERDILHGILGQRKVEAGTKIRKLPKEEAKGYKYLFELEKLNRGFPGAAKGITKFVDANIKKSDKTLKSMLDGGLDDLRPMFSTKDKDDDNSDDLTPMYSMASRLMDEHPQYKDSLEKVLGPKQQSVTRKFLKMMQSAKDGDALTYNTIKDELFAWMRRSLFDTYDQIKVVGKKVDELTGGRLGDLAYKTMRLSTSIDSMMGALLQHGALTWDGGVSKVTTKNEGLLPLIEELGDDAMPWLLSRVARRAQKFINETYTDEDGNVVTKEKWLTQEDVDAYNAIAKPLREARPDLWAKADKQYEALQQSVLDFAVEAGTINKDDMEVWKHAEYIPFYRIITDSFGEESPVVGLPGGKKIISGIHKLEGGKAALDNPLVNITKNWSILVTQAVKNNARTKAIDMALELGDAVVTKVSDKMKGRDNVLNIMRNGRDEYYMIHDREFFRALHTAPSILTNNAIMKVAQKAKRLVTYGATFTLDFRLANMIRDTIQTMALNKDYTFSDAINGFKKAWNEDMDFIELKAAGGAFSSGYLHGTDPNSIVNYVEKVVRKDGKTKVEKLSPMRLLEWWNKVGDAAENANRVALYAKKKNAGALDAAYDAKDLLDFSMRGGNEAMRMMTILIPFLNARIAGLYKMRRAMFKDRIMDGWKPNVTDEFWRTAKMLTLTSGALMAYTMAFHKEEWDDLKPYEKRGYYHLWIGEQHFQVPKPFEMGAIFSSIPEAIFDSMREKDAAILGEAVWATFRDTFAMNPMPQVAKPLTEVWANKNSYTGNDIVPQGMENLESGLQAKEDTKDILKFLGEKFNVSPAKMQHLIQGYMGGMGIMALTAADVIIEASDLKLDNPVNRNNIWGIGKLWRDDEMVSSKQVSEFYEFAREVDKAVYTISALKAQGDVSKLRDYIEDNADLLANKQVVGKMKSAFRNIRTQMKLVKASKTMSADQKDAAIRKLIAVRNGYAEQFVNGIVKRRD